MSAIILLAFPILIMAFSSFMNYYQFTSATTTLSLSGQGGLTGDNINFIDGLFNFAMSPEGLLITIGIIASISAVIGVRVIDSGLGEQSVKIISVTAFGLVLFLMFSYFGAEPILQIPIFGHFIYVLLLLSFAFGIIGLISQ